MWQQLWLQQSLPESKATEECLIANRYPDDGTILILEICHSTFKNCLDAQVVFFSVYLLISRLTLGMTDESWKHTQTYEHIFVFLFSLESATQMEILQQENHQLREISANQLRELQKVSPAITILINMTQKLIR